MTTISEIYNRLVNEYEDGDYVSRACVFNRAVRDGKITQEICDKARDYYGTLWTYVGD